MCDNRWQQQARTVAVNDHRDDEGGQDRSATNDTLSRLLALGTLIEKILKRKLKPWRITLGEFQVLRILDKQGLRQVELANELHRTNATVCRQVKHLIERDCLQQVVDNVDRRAKRVCLTPEGARVRHEAHCALSDTMLGLSIPLDPETRSLFERLQMNTESSVYRDTKELT